MRTPVRVLAAVFAAASLVVAPLAVAQQKIKIGFITTLTGPAGIIGKHMKDSVELAMDHLGNKMGGVPVEVIFGDDQFKPDVGVQVAEEMLKKHQVDIMSGIIWSHVMMAVVPVVTGSGKVMVGTNAGASPLAGASCHPQYFSTSWNNDQTPEAMGKFMQEQGINDVYVLAPNYQAEITALRAKSPKAAFVFYPGGMGVQFVRQYFQAGLRDRIPLYSVFTVDETTLPALKETAIGQWETKFWSPDLNVPASKRFVSDFRKKYGYTPSFYGAQSYDGMMLIDSAVRMNKGSLADTKAVVAAMRKAEYDSIRGPFKWNVNQHPIQDFYLLRAEKGGPDGVEMRIQKKVFDDHKDSYYQDCKMAW